MIRSEHAVILWQRSSREGRGTLSLREMADYSGCHPRIVHRFWCSGVIDGTTTSGGQVVFSVAALRRLRRGLRLRRDLGLGLHALGLVLDLLERIDTLEREVDRLIDSESEQL